MSAATLLRAQAYNNAWANHRLLLACGQLSAADLAADRGAFFGSIINTLNHILIVDWYYVSGLEGVSMGPAAFDPEVPCPGFADLDAAQRAVDGRLIAFCEGVEDAGLSADVALDRGSRIQHERVDRTLLHLFQHQIHHRGQVHDMLSRTGVAPPQLDEFFLESDQARGLREADLADLGFSESAIWR